jgi:RNA polymerase primary sigma factor
LSTTSNSFSTYATYWIKQSIRRGLGQYGSAVRLPQYTTTLLIRWRKAFAVLLRELGRPPAEDEVATRLGLSAKKLSVVRKAIAVHVSRASSDEGDLGEVGMDKFADGRDPAPGVELLGAEERQKAVALLERLGGRAATVVWMRFGLDGSEPATLKQIGEHIGCTRERVRQLEAEALADLRQQMVA